MRLYILFFCFIHSIGLGAPSQLNIYVWAHSISKQIIRDFEKKHDIKINMSFFDSDEVMEAKLYAGLTGFDLIMTSANPFLPNHLKAKFYQKLDKSKLPHYKHLDRIILKRLDEYDPGNNYAVPMLWGVAGIGYNPAKIKTIMPDAPINSWAMIFDPDIIAKFAKCGVAMLDVPTEVIPLMLGYHGKNPLSLTKQDLEFATEKLLQIRPYIKRINSQNYVSQLANGEICLALGWSADIMNARQYAKEANKGVTVEFAFAKELTPIHIDVFAIPTEAKHVDNAHKFIDFMLQPEIIALATEDTFYSNANPDSKKYLPKEIAESNVIFPASNDIMKYIMDKPAPLRYEQMRIRAWQRFKKGK
jgi:putrescine transport system substrate-binding protein